jgi:sterol desaturase/sphingolipid hydroxylase (fatty acid hydroxylase superfamily)
MISFSSFKVFLNLNIPLCIYSYIESILFSKIDMLFGIFYTTFKNCLFIDVIDYKLANTDYIEYIDYNENRIIPEEQFKGEFVMYLFHTSVLEYLTFAIVQIYFINDTHNILEDLLLFIPYSFCFEVIFDLFHYMLHRLCHSKYIYKYIHKIHHTHKYQTTILTFYHSPLDFIISNTVPLILTIYIMTEFIAKPSLFMFRLLSTYKTFIEISGHSGKNANGSSFIQFFWLPKLLNIELHTIHHDLHHTMNNCNYSKRFSLWDKIFGTFYNG